MSSLFCKMWITVCVCVLVAFRADEDRVLQRDFATLAAMLLFMHVSEFLIHDGPAQFTESFATNPEMLPDARHRLRVINLDYFTTRLNGFCSTLKDASKLRVFNLHPSIFHCPSPECAPRNSIANFCMMSSICADFEIVDFVKGSV